jgi:hypothetical protein
MSSSSSSSSITIATTSASTSKDITPIGKFFLNFKDFSYDSSQDTKEEFQRLCTQRGWGEKGLKKIRNEFDKALECMSPFSATSTNGCPVTTPIGTFFSAFRDFIYNSC